MDPLSREGATIFAPITAPGTAGVSVLRISGPEALLVSRKICSFLPQKPESHHVYYGFLKTIETSKDIDEALVTYFEASRSFTGEETVEISCHGSPAILRTILTQLSNGGAVPAQRGEFTYRAVANGRIDLIQAESVLSLVHSLTEPAARLALRQLKGELSVEIQQIEDHLTWILANIEAGIDFTTEDIDVLEKEEIKRRTQIVRDTARHLAESYKKTRPIVEGLRVVLQGRPNSGKSSLLNKLIGEERAIVTSIPGTTRDLVEGGLVVNQNKIMIVDTAGLRATDDPIERIGIQNARAAVEAADYVFYLIEKGNAITQEDLQNLWAIPLAKRVIVFSKSDLHSQNVNAVPEIEGFHDTPKLVTSAKDKDGAAEVREFLEQKIEQTVSEEGAVIIQERHAQLLIKVSDRVQKSLELLQEDASLEFVAFELQEALLAVYELTGKRLDDQIMDRVFKEFCIGK